MRLLSTNLLHYGREEPLPERRVLRAGPLSCLFEAGSIRYVRLGEREIVRRIYGAVREPDWGTVPSRLSGLQLTERPESFSISFTVENVRGGIDFTWRGSITGEPDGTITFVMDGRARTPFRTARTGLCVLHPIAECAGRPCSVEHTDGVVEEGRFPRLISPHQPFRDIRAISHEVAPGLFAEVRFEGDTFEMEDQRNWTDASYKTYSRPLALPYPYRLEAGERVRQTVRMALHGSPSPAERPAGDPTLTLAAGPAAPLPRLGLVLADGGRLPGEEELSRLRALGLGHVRVELRMGDPAWETTQERAARTAQALGTGLEAAIQLGEAPDEGLDGLRAALDTLRPRVSAWLISRDGEPADAGTLDLARRLLGDYHPCAPLGVASAGFVGLNRHRPARGGPEIASYAMNAQVHQFDNTSIVETLDGQAWTLRTAHELMGDMPLAVGPIGLGRAPDERQASLFCAAWTAGSLRRICEGAVRSATYYDTAGPGGIMEGGEGPAFPVYHVFADVAPFASGEALALSVSHPLLVDGLAVRKNGRTRLLIANMTDEPRAVTLSGVRGPARLRTLDETNAERAMRHPEEFRREEGQPTDGDHVELLPYAVARLDWEEGA